MAPAGGELGAGEGWSVKRAHKYKAKPTVIDGIRFASQKEARLDVRPSLTANYKADRGCVYAELCCDVLVNHARRHRSNLQHVGLRQPCESIGATRSLDVAMTAAVYSITRIVFDRARVQVVWAYARRIITVVADKSTAWYGAVVQLIRKAVRQGLFPTDGESAVSLANRVTNPGPASIALADSRPESIYDRAVSVSEEAWTRAVVAVLGSAWADVALKRQSTVTTAAG